MFDPARRWGLVPTDQTVLQEQQTEADLLAQHDLLTRRIDLREAALGYELEFGSKAA